MSKPIRRALLVLVACAASAVPAALPAQGAPSVGALPETGLPDPPPVFRTIRDDTPSRPSKDSRPDRPNRPNQDGPNQDGSDQDALPTVDAATRAEQLEDAPVCQSDAELAVGSSGSSVRCLQRVLRHLDVYHGAINGIYDQVTSDAVRWFQLTNDSLRLDGVAGPTTLTMLGIWSGVSNPPPEPPCTTPATLESGDSGFDVMCLQTMLDKLGLLDGPVDGIFGDATQWALVAYQARNSPLVADGIAGPRTLAAMGIWNGFSEIVPVPVFSNAPAGPWPAPSTSNLPEWRLTAEGVPFYGNRGACTRAQADIIAAQFAADGADIETQQWAAYVASREGGCNYLTVNQNAATRDDSHCTFQLNVLSGTFEPHGELGRHGWTADSVKSSLDACADAASDLWVYCGKGPWTPPYYCKPPWQTS